MLIIHHVDDERAGADLDRAAVEAGIAAALATDQHPGGVVTVRYVDDADSADLHGIHFGDPSPTDVMTFPDGTADPATGAILIGDLAIGVGVARRVATERGRTARDEIVLYAVHGALHLLGHDDRDPADRAAMWAIQVTILAGLGIALEPVPE
jgi:probable rRNA maturation factor